MAACELKKVNTDILTPTEAFAFYLNIYQCMYIHYFMLTVNETNCQKGIKKGSGNFLSTLKCLFGPA